MLAKRIIPCLDCDLSGQSARVVKGTKFSELKYVGEPSKIAEKYYRGGADEICFLDITASAERRGTMLDVVRKSAAQVFVPLTVGGGISSEEEAVAAFKAGADKVSINTSAMLNPSLITTLSKKFGRQAVVVAIDAKHSGSGWKCSIYGGKELTEKDAVEWAKQAESLGAGEILLTSMDKDGTNSGFDLKLTKEVSESVGIPVIASGGAGSPKDLYGVLDKGEADAVLAAGIFQREDCSIAEAKEFLKEKGLEVRI